jgi:hypothetical protein
MTYLPPISSNSNSNYIVSIHRYGPMLRIYIIHLSRVRFLVELTIVDEWMTMEIVNDNGKNK